MARLYNQPCPVAKSLDVLGERWTLLVVRDLLRGRHRFHELAASLPGIAPNVLSDRLKLLEEHGLVERRFYSDHPPRSEEHTSELQSRQYLVCRLLLEKKTTDYK